MNAFRLSKPGAKRVEQNLTARVAPMQFRAIVRAGVVQARLGDVEFRLSNDQLDDMRALYSVALCGGQ
jgi:hypothetical protein